MDILTRHLVYLYFIHSNGCMIFEGTDYRNLFYYYLVDGLSLCFLGFATTNNAVLAILLHMPYMLMDLFIQQRFPGVQLLD